MVTTGTSNASNTSGTKVVGKNFALKTEDFINMMVTQLKNQDPMEPAKNEQLLAQMSQIGQLQSSNLLQDSLKGMVLQNQIGSAGNLLGKSVEGLDANDESVKGIVTSVRVESDNVVLELSNGKGLPLGRVTSIGAAPATSAAASAAK